MIEDPDDIYSQVKRNERGQIFACSHLGNTEVCRALVSHHKDFRLNVLVHSKHAQAFNEALQKAGADHIRLIQVTDLDTTLMMEFEPPYRRWRMDCHRSRPRTCTRRENRRY